MHSIRYDYGEGCAIERPAGKSRAGQAMLARTAHNGIAVPDRPLFYVVDECRDT
jgi:hypothetical protein